MKAWPLPRLVRMLGDRYSEDILILENEASSQWLLPWAITVLDGVRYWGFPHTQ